MTRRAAKCAAVLALLGNAHADTPAFTGVSDLPSVVGQNVRSHSGRGGLAPRMVAGPQDYLTSLDGRAVANDHGDNSRAVPLQNRAAEGAARFYSMDLIAKTKAFLESYRNGSPDRNMLAPSFEFTCSGADATWTKDDFLAGRTAAGAAEFYEFSVDPFDNSRIWFQARAPGQVRHRWITRRWPVLCHAFIISFI
jgi:hypothetical protein